MDDPAVPIDHAPDVQQPLFHLPGGLSPQVPGCHPGVVHDPRVVANLDLGAIMSGSYKYKLLSKLLALLFQT